MRWYEACGLLIAIVFTVCYSYQYIYMVIPFFKKAKPHKPTVNHRYAVLIAARNEEGVILQLIDSIHGQDYPAELIDVFVVADNCTDRTAEVAQMAGATVVQRFNKTQVGKGYALDYLLHRIPAENYDAFLVFDADNLLDPHYFTEMNRTFSDGYPIITSYRNSKNYGDNWITAGYSLWFIRDSALLNYPRFLTNVSAVVAGTGFLFSSEVMEEMGGWKYHCMTEDTEFTADQITKGRKIGYCHSAVFYDEQPTKFSQSWTQRMRWSKGFMQVLGHYWQPLLSETLRGNFSCYDMTMAIFPAMFLTILSLLVNAFGLFSAFLQHGSILQVIWNLSLGFIQLYGVFLIIGLITTLTQWKQIRTTVFKKVLYLFTFPVFMMTYIPIAICSLFMKVQWKPIRHTKAVSITQISDK